MLGNKKLMAGEYKTYPHCISKDCKEYKYAFRLKHQNDSICPAINCNQKSLNAIINDTSNTIQTCRESKSGSLLPMIGIMVLVLGLGILAFLYLRPKKKDQRKK